MAEFTWIPFYKELAQKTLHYKNRQNELIEFLNALKNKNLPVTPLNDIDSNNQTIKLEEIDLFTFIAVLNRGITEENRKKIAAEIKQKFEIITEIPSDFAGIPTIQSMHSWFFSYKKSRKENDIPMLWELAEYAINNPDNIPDDLFNNCLKIIGVGIKYISFGLFWINPEKFAACDDVLIETLKKQGFKDVKLKTYNDYLKYLQRLKDFKPDKTFYELSHEAWIKTRAELESDNLNRPEIDRKKDSQYWLYSPGQGANKWEEFYAKGIMAIGWGELGDLREFPDKAAMIAKLQETSGEANPGSKKNDSTACDDFLNKIRIGDVVIAKSKQKELIGYGVVTSDYDFDATRPDYKSYRKVDWKAKGHFPTDFLLVQKTLTDITKYSDDHPDYKKYSDRLMAIIKGNYKPLKTNNKIEHDLNRILFGPPGTGKTYNSINHALAIIENKKVEELEDESVDNRKEILARYKQLVESGQIVFTTFHQSMCYEDFIEGIKPIEDDDQLNYELKEGIFKTIAEDAWKNYKGSKNQSVKKPFDEVWNNFLKPLNDGEPVKVQMKKSSFEISHVSDKTIFFNKDSGDSKHSLSINTLKAMYNDGANNVIKGGLQPYYEPLLNELLKGAEEVKKEDLKNFVLIIDEINRGNVSQIFGELITLIEKDKRLGAMEELTVTMPYSKKKGFGVPSNLYIIGTMNTADRSVEALDTALRRRFTFVEMPPDYELSHLETEIIEGISLKNILQTLNNRIEKLLDKDHLIGHSYFLEIDSIQKLQEVFQNNIIPLLQEYFYGDFSKMGLVLGEAFFEKNNDSDKIQFARFKHDAIDDLKARTVVRLKRYWLTGEFEKAIIEMVYPA